MLSLRPWLVNRHAARDHWQRRTGPGPLAVLATALLGTLASALAAGATVVAPAAKGFHWGAFLAPFHAVVLHFPIGFFTVAVILEFHGASRRLANLQPVIRLVVWLSFYAGLVAALFGILRAQGEGYDHKALELHRWTGLSIPLLTLATLALQRRAAQPDPNPGVKAGYHLVMLLTLGQLVLAGHFGGNLTHGSKYLTEHAPQFVREFLEPASAPPAGHSVVAGESEPAEDRRAAEIAQLLAMKCGQCHGPEKQKGGYRVDQPRHPGKSGKSPIVAGDPFASHLARLILLPPEHDDVMPPAGKPPLTPEEILSVIHWIQAGANETGRSSPPQKPAR